MNSPSPISSSTSSTATTPPGKTLLTPSRAIPPMRALLPSGTGNGSPAATAAASAVHAEPVEREQQRARDRRRAGWRTATAPGSSAMVAAASRSVGMAEDAAGEHDPRARRAPGRAAPRTRAPGGPSMRPLLGDDRLRDRVARVGGVEHDGREPVVLRPPASPPRRVNACSSVDRVGGAEQRERPLGERGRRAHAEARRGRRRAAPARARSRPPAPSGQKPRWNTRPSGRRAPTAL